MVRGRDACWEHCVLVDATRQKVRCNYCQREFSGGVYRMKFHLAQIKNKDIVPCPEVPNDVRDLIQSVLSTPKKQKNPKKPKVERAGNGPQNSSSASGGFHPNPVSSGQNGSTCPSLLFPRPSPSAQPIVDDAQKQKHDDADKKIALFFFHNSIPFSATKSMYYQEMVDAVADCAMLEDISKQEWVSTVMEEARTIIGYIYSHTWILNLMRKFTGGMELIHPRITRFVTNFISLRSIVIQEDNLKHMFSHAEWLSSVYSRRPDAQAIKSLLYLERFWKSAHEVVTVSEPLVKVLRIVDGDMPAMGYIYEGIERAKVAIKAYYKGTEEKYKPIWDIIDRRLNTQLHLPLYAAAAFLNPSIFYNPNFKMDLKMRNGFQEAMLKMATEDKDKIEITKEHLMYINAQGALGSEFAIMGRTLNAPGDWWAGYGYEVPTLQRAAIRILSQPCSSYWCRWNRSTFENIHTKNRNRMEQEKFNDLVFVHCNLRLQALSQNRHGKCKPVIYDEIDVSSEWPTESESSSLLLDDSCRLLLQIDRMFDSIIEEHFKVKARKERSNDGENKDLLQIFFTEDGNLKGPLTKSHLKSLLLYIVAAGTDTASSVVEWAMAEMMNTPETMRRAQEELAEVVGMSNMVEESHLPQLLYLDAVVKEVLRLHPPGPFLVPRRSRQSCIVSGYTIPKGTQVLVNMWAIHRDPEIWDSPLEFQPERFLRATVKLDYSGNDFRYLPFRSGRRKCAGIPLAERMTPHVLASLLHSFNWKLQEGVTLDLSEKFGLVPRKTIPFVAIPMPRLSNSGLFD
ncbi:hypothetical protein HHK36_028725 [Tetracentron sinense]|uniref:BED-type domain-containing protein n=1 Tax=Tetracentron sinense TaxID=13715 RepID=A0A834YGB1_TETSI|nr:hypothetical protein HHK36_028725 [Tetracentron sinense]